ncbi:hypothetical protein G3A_16835 [Bacillus sp. 17376]|nr:hypothetical protein G3A_16835 [Bacillus sp. 17376]
MGKLPEIRITALQNNFTYVVEGLLFIERRPFYFWQKDLYAGYDCDKIRKIPDVGHLGFFLGIY